MGAGGALRSVVVATAKTLSFARASRSASMPMWMLGEFTAAMIQVKLGG